MTMTETAKKPLNFCGDSGKSLEEGSRGNADLGTNRMMKKGTLLTLTCALVTLSFQAVSEAALIGYYPFDVDASDASGNGNDGTPSGDAALAGVAGFNGAGSAYQFSGAGHVVVPINSNPSVYPDMTVTMWVRPDSSIVGAPGLYKTFGHDDGGWDRTFGLDNRNGAYRYAAFTGGGITPATATPVTGEWTFIAAVWNTDNPSAGSNTVTFYAGSESVTVPLTNTASVHTTSAIGNLRPDVFNEGWVGLIDDVRIFDTALTPAEIADIMAIPEPSSGLLVGLGAVGLLLRRRRR